MKLKLVILPGLFLALAAGISSTWLAAQKSPREEAAKSVQKAASQAAVPKADQSKALNAQAAPQVTAPKTALPKGDAKKAASPLSHKVIAYYFHGRGRCPSCLKIEAYTQEAVRTGFADPLKTGLLEWRVINVEEPGNEHFVKDFKLYTKSVVIVDIRDGKQKQWKNLAKVWELLYDKNAFLSYVRDEVNSYLKGT